MLNSKQFAEKFMQRGIEYQYEATSTEVATKAFKTSCRICSTRGIHLECDRCGISTAHNSMMLILDGTLKMPS